MLRFISRELFFFHVKLWYLCAAVICFLIDRLTKHINAFCIVLNKNVFLAFSVNLWDNLSLFRDYNVKMNIKSKRWEMTPKHFKEISLAKPPATVMKILILSTVIIRDGENIIFCGFIMLENFFSICCLFSNLMLERLSL